MNHRIWILSRLDPFEISRIRIEPLENKKYGATSELSSDLNVRQNKENSNNFEVFIRSNNFDYLMQYLLNFL